MAFFFYRRPDYIAKVPRPLTNGQCELYVERTQKHKRAIPPDLSFEKIVQDKALPPASLSDFMEYLRFVSHDAENLQFYLWLQDYSRRFVQLPSSEQALSPPWDPAQYDRRKILETSTETPESDPPTFTDLKIDFDQQEPRVAVPGYTAASSTLGESPNVSYNSGNATVTPWAEGTHAAAPFRWEGFTIQPLRVEVDRMIAQFLSPHGSCELNVSYRERAAALQALQHTTHPSALRSVQIIVENVLRRQSHPNFIRWSICNGNKPRMMFVRIASFTQLVAGLVLATLLVLTSVSRWWRVLCFPLLLLSIGGFVATYKGLCVIIHHQGQNRALRPWEHFPPSKATTCGSSLASKSIVPGEEARPSSASVETHTSKSYYSRSAALLDTFSTETDCTPDFWVEKYRQQSLLRKIFARQVRVENNTVRLLQDRIVWQSHAWALLISLPLTVLFVALPRVGVI